MEAVNNTRGLKPQSQGGENMSGSGNKAEIPLPSDLKRILKEVARTGACSWLSWDQDAKEHLAGEYSYGAPAGSTGRSMLGASASAPSLTGTRQPFSTHRRQTSSTFSTSLAQAPPRKKHRNSLHKSGRRRFTNSDGSSTAGGNRKRPLLLIRTHPNTTANASAFSAPGSAGSGRTSGSEPDDSTQYECDSEGTSTTTNSEVSLERMRKNQQRMSVNALQTSHRSGGTASLADDQAISQSLRTLQEAFRMAVAIVLDHFYRNRGGYKLSPAEKRRNETLFANRAEKLSGLSQKVHPLSPEDVFLQRRQKLVAMLLPRSLVASDAIQNTNGAANEPPFTIQRIAEVLVAPERYYTQTHKLCNCLEKLLLVTSSTGAFGGSTGGDTSQSRREEREMAALADERGRQESELRQRRMRRRPVSPSDDAAFDNNTDMMQRSNGHLKDDPNASKFKGSASNDGKSGGDDGDAFSSSARAAHGSREMLEAAARASLRTKFDHVGIDPHSSPDRDVRSIAENRGMTNSPPPPSLALSAAPSNISLQSHGGVSGFVRQHVSDQSGDHHSLPRVPSPILFPPSNEATMHSATSLQPGTNMHMLQLHHAVALAGVSLGRVPRSSLELMGMEDGAGVTSRQYGGSADGADLDVEHGRSSASNSDVDSESDDISLDDSASDRSDGSDSGSGTHYEPFTAARAMALNRMQQQQRLQSRVLTSLNSLHQSEFRPPADSEYQSGDSIDSMRAEDSGGSDSSSQSSDLAD